MILTQRQQIPEDFLRMNRIHPMDENDEPNPASLPAALAQSQHTIIRLQL
jgi:hypothetical protein